VSHYLLASTPTLGYYQVRWISGSKEEEVATDWLGPQGANLTRFLQKFQWPVVGLGVVLVLGTFGYKATSPENTLFDCLYMTFITITTIGYGEVVDLSHNTAGRLFTFFIGLSGFGIITFMLSSLTAFIVEGKLKETFWRRKMEKKARQLSNHYIVCGMKREGFHIVQELHSTGRPHVIIDLDPERVHRMMDVDVDAVVIEGDATDDEVLLKAGIKAARGIFAATGDDNQDLVISLTARQLNHKVRVVTSCTSLRNIEKMYKAGADAVVSPRFIGGLRMASEMIRPTVVTFLDLMLRDKEKNLRVEEVEVPPHLLGKNLRVLELQRFPEILLMAVKCMDDWLYNPQLSYVMAEGDVLIIMTPPGKRLELEKQMESLS